jgi:AIPR protein
VALSLVLIAKGEGFQMDRVTKSYLNEFSEVNEITNLPEDKRFEHLAGYVVARRHYGFAFDTADIVTGESGDCGIDAICIFVNGALITDVESIEDLAELKSFLDVTFCFIQAKRTSAFESAKMGQFFFGVSDFFRDAPALKQNEMIRNASKIMSTIYEQRRFRPGNPVCELYYVTTGNWQGDQNLEARRSAAIADLTATNLFRHVSFDCFGAADLQRLYERTKNSIRRDFSFEKRTEIPKIADVTESYIGFLPVKEFLTIISDDNGDINDRLFVDNPRDWQGFNAVNSEIDATLKSEDKNKFVLMNNGVTVIAASIQRHAAQFTLEDFYIVNGCQTSNLIFMNRTNLDDSVMVPFRLIVTQNENIKNLIIKGTNRQTAVKQFLSLDEFAKSLERFFGAMHDEERLYYERRPGQYDRQNVQPRKIINQENLIRSFAAMFLEEPHRTTKNYSAVSAKIGKEIFVTGHKPDPYHMSALAYYKVDVFFKNTRLPARLKPARFHLLLAIRLLANLGPVPRMNSHDIERYCNTFRELVCDKERVEGLILEAASIVERVAAGNFDRDKIRTQPFTEKLIRECSGT